MKIVVMNGSPKKDRGNTAFIIEKVISILNNNEVSYLYPCDDEIYPCYDCGKCFGKNNVCVIDDDMKNYVEKLSICDLLIISTPIYTNFMTAPLKAVLDRLRILQSGFYSINSNGDFSPNLINISSKNLLLISTCGFPEVKTFNSLEVWFDDFCEQYDGFNNVGKILFPAFSLVKSFFPKLIYDFNNLLEKRSGSKNSTCKSRSEESTFLSDRSSRCQS